MFRDSQWCVVLRFGNGSNKHIVVGPFDNATDAQRASERYGLMHKATDTKSKIEVEPILSPSRSHYKEDDNPNQLVMEFGEPVVGDKSYSWEKSMEEGQTSIDDSFKELKERLAIETDPSSGTMEELLHDGLEQAAALGAAIDIIRNSAHAKDLAESGTGSGD